MSKLTVDKITTDAGLDGLRTEWVALEERSKNTLPFRTADWTISWWQHLRQDRPAVRDTLAIRTVRTAEGELVGVAPMMLTSRPGMGVVRSHCLHFIGADPNATELRGPLFSPRHQDDGYAALYADMTARDDQWDWSVLSGVPEESEAFAALKRSGLDFKRRVPYYTVALEGDWTSFKASRPRNVKESLRKCYNSLKRDNLTCRLDVAQTRSEIAVALRDFRRLHEVRAEQEGGTRHANVFGTDRMFAFLTDVTGRLADRGIARVFRLFIGDRVVAARVAFIQNGCLYLYYSGYDPDAGKYSIATTLLAEAIQYAFGLGLNTLNLSTGADVSKMRWRPTEWAQWEGTGVSSRPAGRVTHGAVRLVGHLLERRSVRTLVQRFAALR
jgi:CelD/BcsL family acetyltransferase involved in cellulose biosynthesis